MTASVAAWIFFIFYQVAIGCDKFFSVKPICSHNTINELGSNYNIVGFVVLGGFMMVWIIVLIKIIRSKSKSERTPLIVQFNILSMSVIATALTTIWDWGGVCIDRLG